MEITKISPDRIKIILTEADMRLYSITRKELCYNTKRALRIIFDEANIRNGENFSPEGSEIKIFDIASGGYEIYITKIALSDEDDVIKKEGEEKYFAFSTLDGLLKLCKRLAESEYVGEVSIFCLKSRWFAKFCGGCPSYVCDYGGELREIFGVYINEQGSLLYREKDIKILSQLI